jgi:signal transduction histidine kinase
MRREHAGALPMPGAAGRLQAGRIVFVLTAVAALVVSTPAAEPQPSAARAPDRAPYVYVGHESFPPFEYLDQAGRPAGFNIELVRAIAREAGVRVEFRLLPWREAIARLHAGAGDLASVALTESRAARFEWLDRTWTLQQVVVARDGHGALPMALDEMAGETVAVSVGSALHDMLLSLPEVRRPLIVPTGSSREALALLAAGEVNFAVGQELTFREEIARLGGPSFELLPMKALSYHLVTKVGRAEAVSWVREGFSRVRASGEYRRIVERHLVPSAAPLTWRDVREWLIAGVGALVALGLAGWFWQRSMRREIAARQRAVERTRQLQELTALLAEAITPEAAADVVLRHGLATFGAAAGAVCRLDESGRFLFLVRGAGYPQDVAEKYEKVALAADLPVSVAARTQTPLFFTSRDQIEVRFPGFPLRPETQAMLAAPLELGGRILGALGMSFDAPCPFDENDRTFVMTLARQCALALERARLYEAERRARNQAEQASRAKDEFLATLSHELRTPLNAIVGWTHMLRIGMLPPDRAAQAIETIERNARAQTQLIEDLLDVSRATMGTLQVKVEPLEVGECLGSAIKSLQPAADARRISIGFTPVGYPVWVSGDASRLQQVFWNLLSNAIKFTPMGGRVTVAQEVRGEEVVVVVTDSGRGIEAAALPRVFEQFYQSEPSAMRTQGGLGIGLSIVRRLVELHGGTVAAESPGLGEGSSFTVRLPVASGPGLRPADTDTRAHA